MRQAVTLDSDISRRPAQRERGISGDHYRLPDTRYPNAPAWSSAGADNDDLTLGQRRPQSTGRLRAAMLIIIAVVALSAIATIGWLQYQSDAGPQDRQFQLSEPDRSVPAEVAAPGR